MKRIIEFGIILAVCLAMAWFVLQTKAYCEVELTLGPTWKSVKASPFDCDVAARCTVTEAHVRVAAPWVRAEMIVQSPVKFAGSFTIPADRQIGALRFVKDDGEIQYDGQVSTQRCKFGVKPYPWVYPYLTAVSRTSDWTFWQLPKSGTEKRLRSYRPTTGIGGGVRLAMPMSAFLLAYGDGSWDTIGWQLEGGLEARYRQYVGQAFIRNERDNLVPANAWSLGAQAGVRF